MKNQNETQRTPIDPATVAIQHHVTVIGRNPEAADMDNPRGEIYQHVFSVTCLNPADGWHMALTGSSHKDRDRVQRIADEVIRVGTVDWRRWSHLRPSYGTQDWEDDTRQFEADQLAAERY